MKYEDFLTGLRKCCNSEHCIYCPLCPTEYNAVCAAIRNIFHDNCCSIDDIETICNAVKETE